MGYSSKEVEAILEPILKDRDKWQSIAVDMAEAVARHANAVLDDYVSPESLVRATIKKLEAAKSENPTDIEAGFDEMKATIKEMKG